MKKKKVLIIVGIVLLLVIAGIATSYALFSMNVTKNTVFKVGVGKLELTLNDTNSNNNFDQSGNAIIENLYPMKDTDGLNQEGYHFTVTNAGSMDAGYTIYLDDVVKDSIEVGRVNSNLIKINFTNNTTNTTHTYSLSDLTDRILETGTIDKNTTYSYTIKIWLDYDAGNEAQNKYYGFKIRIDSVQKNTLSYDTVLYSAASDTVYYYDASNNRVDLCTTDANGMCNVTLSPAIIYTLYSSVAKNPNNISSPYTKEIDASTMPDTIYLMPEKTIYWYGYRNNLSITGYKVNYDTGDGAANYTPNVTYSPNYFRLYNSVTGYYHNNIAVDFYWYVRSTNAFGATSTKHMLVNSYSGTGTVNKYASEYNRANEYFNLTFNINGGDVGQSGKANSNRSVSGGTRLFSTSGNNENATIKYRLLAQHCGGSAFSFTMTINVYVYAVWFE